MDILARRFTIIILGAAIFAMAFSAVVQNTTATMRVHNGTAAPCYHAASSHCSASL